MKIAIDCRMLGSGGIGTYISELIPFFLERDECLLIGRPADIERYRATPNAELCPCDIEPFSLRELIAFPREIAKRVNSCDAYYTPYCNIPSGISIPIFSTIHDIVFLDVPGLASQAGTLARKWFYAHAVRKSRAVFTVSEFSADRIRARLNCKKPLVVTYSAVPSWLQKDASGEAKKDDTILFVGNIKKHKGLHILLPAFKAARAQGLREQLVIVGNADNFRTGDAAIFAEIEAMPKGSVRFTGKVTDEELKRLYERATLLVQPSLYEGFGLPPLEALTLGTNALISDLPVFKEIYAGYPVRFFASDDSKDLAARLRECVGQQAPSDIPRTYSFGRTYGLINAAIRSHLA